MASALPPGVYVPMPTFFLEEPADEQPVDVDTIAKHVKFLCSSGVHGVVCMGSTGEAVHLTEEERQLVLRTARKAIDDLGSNAKLIAGCSQESVSGTLNLIQQAAAAGADYAMILPPSYFLTWVVNRSDVIYSFYTKVADKSPLPIVIYNFPGVTQQMDTTQETIVKLAAHPNIVGIKCTDGNVGKAAYVCSQTDPKQFTLMSGSADSFLPFLSIGAQGCVPGFGNVAPRVLVQLFDLYTNHFPAQWKEIQKLQATIVAPDHAFFRWSGISGVKSGMQSVLGYGGLPRAPLLPTPDDVQEKVLKAIEPALVLERQLAAKSSSN
jgi:dihydrodipicolinate synthase/N-acetylneuraminate lyase